MSFSVNNCSLGGNVTRDIELKVTPGGMSIADIGIAVNSRRKGPDGQYMDEVSFFNLTAFGKTAEIAAEYLRKGTPAMFECTAKQDQWTDNEGQKRTAVKFNVNRLILLPRNTNDGNQPARQQPATTAPEDFF